LATIAAYPQAGHPIPAEAAAGEILNLLRPTVAVSYFVMFAAMAMHQHPSLVERLGDDGFRARFVDEVRRTTPLFPLVAGRAVRDFEWRGALIRSGPKCFLDLYGTNHDEQLFHAPNLFAPDRFLLEDVGNVVSQGGGDPATGHRCAGEGAARALVDAAVRLLCTAMTYVVPAQDLHVDLRRMPARPRNGLRLTSIWSAA
jgi:fatty-acid peroxygenase